MNIETELPEDFESFSNEKKIQELERLKMELSDSEDSQALKKRLIEEMIRTYSERL
jgi:hypothetical protein